MMKKLEMQLLWRAVFDEKCQNCDVKYERRSLLYPVKPEAIVQLELLRELAGCLRVLYEILMDVIQGQIKN